MDGVTAVVALLSGFVASSLCLHAYTLLHLFRHEHTFPSPLPAEQKMPPTVFSPAAVIKRPPVIIDDAAALEIELEHREKKRPLY